MHRALTAAAPCRRLQHAAQAWSLCRTSRCYATTTDPPRKSSSSSSSQYADSPWRRPLASAQTLSLLSTSPRALLFALEQSLQGAIKAIEKTTPQGAKGKAGDRDSFTLVFAVDKTLPSEVLGEATSLLRDVDMPHVGVLCDPLPEEWLPAAALGDSPSSSSSSSSSSPSSQQQLLHLISLSLLPSTLVTPFTSSIPGAAPIKAGRWATGKAAFDDDQSRVGALGSPSGEEGKEKDWRDLWGRENASNALPEALEGMRGEDVLATILVGSDDAPQGLLEGLDARHAAGTAAAGPLVGALASNTFFETGGRDRCMFFRSSSKAEKEVRDSGAVGLVFANKQAAGKGDASGSGSKPSLETKTPWQRLEALPPQATKPRLRRITRAKGNIISLLSESTEPNDVEGRNACQCFLRDVAEGRSTSASPSSSTATSSRNPMSVEEQRSLSSRVAKDEDFWAAVYRHPSDAEGATPRPLLVSLILSGHPGRGTLSLETDLNLAESGRDPIATLGEEKRELWIQFFKQVSPSPRRKEQHHTVIDVPGPDLGAWALPRFLFVSTTASPNHSSSSSSSSNSQEAAASPAAATAAAGAGGKEKARVHALPNVFLLPTSAAPSATAGGADAADSDGAAGGGGGILKREARGAVAASGAGLVGGGDGGGEGKGEVRLSSELEKRTGMWRLPGTSVMLDLRGTTKKEEE